MNILIKKFFSKNRKSIKGGLPMVGFSELCCSGDFDVKIMEPNVIDGNISIYELFIINTLVRKFAPKTVFEFGTFNGRTTLNLAANSSAHSNIYTIDLPSQMLDSTRFKLEDIERKFIEKPLSGELFVAREESKKITQLYGDSAEFDFTSFFGGYDFVFIDGSHTYDYVLNDSKIALNLLRNNKGIILWHDYGEPEWWPGVTRALDELRQNSEPFANLIHIEGTKLAVLIKG